ncbi:hypothetical protein BOX15_Mlig023141g2 [Macrostomum lignano]|uniref:Uncharacterized protein n=1 Tax=Macrostomum lignano TaxID=282301 RepID=A0A267E4F6_9PLAT|nr:hypothetical protein BOX15_Mlig023141g2 [Macrostomum lignano]
MPNPTKRTKPAKISVAKRLRYAAAAAAPGINGKSQQASKKQKKRPEKVKAEEEITSESEIDEPVNVAAAAADLDSAAMNDDDNALETPQEARVRLAQQLIGELKAREAERLGYGDEDEDDDDEDEEAHVTGAVSARLQSANLRRAGRLRASFADAIVAEGAAVAADAASGSVSLAKNWHRLAVTCVQLGDNSLYTASKDGSVARWSLQAVLIKDGDSERRHLRRVAHVPGGLRQRCRHSLKSKPKAKTEQQLAEADGAVLHRGHVLCMALSSDQTRLATGDADGLVLVWQADSLQLVHQFRGHRAAVNALAFRRRAPGSGSGGGLHLFSGSHDKTVRHWGLGGAPDCGLGFIEALFGHSAPVLGLDAMRLDRCISCGGPDKSLRLWKLAEESQLVFELPPGGGPNSCECVAMVTEQVFASGQGDGSLCLWSMQKKRPVAKVAAAHGPDRWVTALAAVKNADLLASGSWDGLVRLWRVAAQPGSSGMTLSRLLELPAAGFVNQLAFWPASADEEPDDDGGGELRLAAGLGQEHKWGRWLVDKSARNMALVWRLALPN